MICPQCGSQVADGAKFCTSCGAMLQAPAAAAVQQAVQEAPAYEAPQAPAYEAPVYEAPAYEAPQAPAYEAPVYEAPAYEAPQAPAYEAPVYEAPAYEAPQAPAYEAPVYEAPAYEAPQAPAYEAPVYEAPAYEAPAYEAPQQPQYQYQQPQYQQPQYQQPQYQQPQYQQPQFQQNPPFDPGFQPQVEEPKKKKGKAGLIIGIVAGVVAIAAIVILLVSGVFGKKAAPVDVNLNDYVVITLTGISGDGEADVAFDADRFHEDFDESLVWTCKKKNMPSTSVTDYICENVGTYLSTYYGLKNGDQIEVEVVDYFSEYGEIYPDSFGNNAVITCSNYTYTVADLEEPVTFDPFEGAEITISGTEGDTWVTETWRSDLEAMDFLYITTDDDLWSLKNGDVIHYYIYDYDEDSKDLLVSLYGMYPSVTEWEYTVTGLEHVGYITDPSEIPSSFGANCSAAVDEYLGDYLFAGADYQEAKVSYLGNELLGFYYWTLNEGASDIDTNVYYAVVKVSLSYVDAAGKTNYVDYYYYARLTDLYLNADGTVTFYEGDFYDYNVSSQSFEVVWDGFTNDGQSTTYTMTVNGTQTLPELVSEIKGEADHFSFVSNME